VASILVHGAWAKYDYPWVARTRIGVLQLLLTAPLVDGSNQDVQIAYRKRDEHLENRSKTVVETAVVIDDGVVLPEREPCAQNAHGEYGAQADAESARDFQIPE